jgi:hypothetical protein
VNRSDVLDRVLFVHYYRRVMGEAWREAGGEKSERINRGAEFDHTDLDLLAE